MSANEPSTSLLSQGGVETTWRQVILQNQTQSVNFSEFSPKWLRIVSKYSSMKILQVSGCPPLNKVLKLFLQNYILNLLKSCSHMIVIVIEGTFDGNVEGRPLIAKLIEKLRPLIVQVKSDTQNLSKIYFENREFQTEVETSSFSPAFHLFEFFEKKLMAAYKTHDSVFIAEHGSSFSLRMCKLTQNETNYEKWLREVEASMKSKKLENFKAVMNFPIEKRTQVDLERGKNRISDIKNVDLLAMAIQIGNVEVAEFLVTFKCDLLSNVQLAWSIKQYECLSVLLEADAPFPNDFDEKKIEKIPDRLHQTLFQRKFFYREISRGNLKSVKRFVNEHPKLKYAYDQQHQSALKTSLISRQFEVYSFLKSKGYASGIDATFDEALENLGDIEKSLIRDINDKSIVADIDNSHLMKLCLMSRLTVNDKLCSSEQFTEIREMFENLNEIPEISTILKMCALSEDLQIVFDFNQKASMHKDSSKAGASNTKKNTIYVGAKHDPEDPFGKHGILAHELTHHAIQKMYMNFFRPYEKNCGADFGKVYAKCIATYIANRETTDLIIKDAFENFECESAHAELIARPPHLLASYQNDPKTLFLLKETFTDLFDYFTIKVLKNLETEVKKNRVPKNQKKNPQKRKTSDSGENSKKRRLEEESVDLTADFDRDEIMETDQNFQKLDESNRSVIEFNLLQTSDIMNILSQQRFKMVTIENCPTFHGTIDVLIEPNCLNSLAESKIFILVLNVAEPIAVSRTEYLQLISEALVKPMILQLNNEDGKSIYYKEANESFRRLILTKDSEIEDVSVVNGIDFEILCNLLHFGSNFGIFGINLDISATEVAMEKNICGLRLIDWAVKHNNMLCLMFLQLFNPNLESCNESQKRVLEVAAEHGTMQSFEIILNARDIGNLDSPQKRILNLNSKNNENLLMISVRSEKLEIAKFLLQNDANVNQRNESDETASDIAWTNKNLDIFFELFYNDTPFPKNFSVNELKWGLQAVRLKKLIFDRQNFHEAIKNGRLEDVKSFIENKKFKFAYDKNNQCALATALQSKNFKIYSFLRSKGFSSGIDYNLEWNLQELDGNDRESLTNSNLKYFQTNDNQHILDLVSKSRLAFGNDQKHFGKIQKIFETLDAIPEISLVLKVAASAEAVDIIFDFDRSSVAGMAPIDPGSDARSKFYKSGHIFVAAMQDDEIVLGALACDLFRYALQFLYNNNCLPFHENDESWKMQFKAIAETYDNEDSKSKNEIIAKALSGNISYESKLCDLIATVPHLLALHSKNKEILAGIRDDFSFLFHFFEQKTLPDMKKEESLIKPKREIREANNYFGVYAKAVQSDWLSPDFSRTIDISGDVFIESSVPDLIFESIVRQIKFEINSNHVFVTLEQILDSDNLKIVKNLAKSSIKPTIFIKEDFDEVYRGIIDEELSEILCKFKTFFISKNKNSVFRKCFQSEINFDFKWNDLNEKSKVKILTSKVLFQDTEVFFNEIVTEMFLQQLDCPIELILNPSKLKLQSLEETLPNSPRAFIERTFQVASPLVGNFSDSESICDLLKGKEMFLIADAAGTGKSTAAAQIARELKIKNPSFWMVFIDLKQHTNVFPRDDQLQSQNIDLKFYSRKLLKFESNFEQRLFESFYERRKLIFIFDGFDEICPDYKQFVINMLENIQNSGSPMLVTTRPHLVEELQNKLKTVTRKLKPLTKQDQIEFLTNYWQQATLDTDLESKIEKMMENFCGNGKYKDFSSFFEVPVNILSLAEAFGLSGEEIPEINIFSLYQRFVTIKINIWKEKGPLAADDTAKFLLTSINLQQIFQKLAFDQVFEAREVAELNLPETPDDISDEMVARLGIINFHSEGTKKFVHKTFAEYFAADFIFREISKKDPKKSVLALFSKSLLNKNFEIIRNFMNDGLCSFQNKLNIDALSKHFKVIVVEHDEVQEVGKLLLMPLVEEGKARLISFVLKNLSLDSNLKLNLVKEVFFESVCCFESFATLWNCLENFVDKNDLKSVRKELLMTKKSRNIFMAAVESDCAIIDSPKVSTFILEKAKRLLTDEEIFELVNCKEYWQEQNLFVRMDARSIAVIKMIWQAAEEKLSKENLKNLVADKIFLRRLIQYIEFEDFTELWKFVEENVETSLRSKMILHKFRGKTLFETALSNEDKSVTDLVFDLTESALLEQNVHMIDSLRHQGILNDFIMTTVVWSEKLFKKFSSQIGRNEFYDILLGKTAENKNIFHCLAYAKNPNEAVTMWNLIVAKISDQQKVETLLFEKDPDWNVFECSASCNNPVLLDILHWCKQHLDHKKCNEIFFRQSNKLRYTLLHVLAAESDAKLVTDCLSFLKEIFPKNKLDALFSIEDGYREIPLQKTLKNKRAKVVIAVWNAYCEVFECNSLKNTISTENFVGVDFDSNANNHVRTLFHNFRRKLERRNFDDNG